MQIIIIAPKEALSSMGEQRVSEAELYLSVGEAVRTCLQQGLPLPFIAERIRTTVEQCLLALRFAESPNSLKLEALVEEWPWAKIVSELTAVEFDAVTQNA